MIGLASNAGNPTTMASKGNDLPAIFGSYERATGTSRVIYRIGRWNWVVQFEDSDTAHPVEVIREGDTWRGICQCPHYQQTGETCAHLWAVYLAANAGVLEVSGVNEALTSDECPVCKRTINKDQL